MTNSVYFFKQHDNHQILFYKQHDNQRSVSTLGRIQASKSDWGHQWRAKTKNSTSRKYCLPVTMPELPVTKKQHKTDECSNNTKLIHV